MRLRIILICCFFVIFTNEIFSQNNTLQSVSRVMNSKAKVNDSDIYSIQKVDESNSKLSEMIPTLLEPPEGRVYHGVQLMTFDKDSGDPIAGYLAALNDSTIQPAVRGLFFSIPGTRGPAKSLSELGKFLNTADSVGFIPELSLFLVSEVAEDSVIAESDKYDWVLDSIITICKKRGKSMFLRIGGEFNGAGEGWNGGGYHPYLYVKMFRKIVDMFTAKGLRDSIATNWCYEPAAANDFDSVDSRGARWYPGDDYIDWFGLDVFNYKDFDQSLPDYDNRGITNKGKSERFLTMARTKGKPVFMSETSAMDINISPDEQDGINDWNNWFSKFWHFIDVHKEIKGFAYINANWPIDAYPTWGDARIQNSPYVTQKYREEMKNPKYIHLKSGSVVLPQLPEKVILLFPPNNHLTNNSEIDLIWQKSFPDVKSYHLQISQTNRFNRYLVNDSTIADTTYKFANLIADSSYFWRVSAKNISGSGPWSDVWMFKRNRNVSVDENHVINGIKIYPNPAGNFIEIDFNNWTSPITSENIYIYNLNGEMVFNTSIQNTDPIRIDISKLPTEVYFIEIGDKKAKFIKE